MENIEATELDVVQVNDIKLNATGKDADMEMNNNNDEGLMDIKASMSSKQPPMAETMAENAKSEEIAEDKPKSVESVHTDNGDTANVEDESAEGDLKVEHGSTSVMSDGKMESHNQPEQMEPSEPSKLSANVNDAQELAQGSESGTSENVTEKTMENSVKTAVDATPNQSEQSPEHQEEASTDHKEEESTVNAAEEKDATQSDTEKNDNDANETVKNDSPKRSPRKKSTNQKRKNRSQKKQSDYSDLIKYTVSVSQRQRRYSLHVPRGRVINAPDDDCEIFCSNIPINVLEGELIPLFERYGKIWELRLMMSMHNPQRNAGFAFVRYTSNESATEATEKLNKYEILPGKLLAIRLSQPNLSLFVGNIHRGLTREQIHEKISNRTNGLVKTFVKTSLYEDTKNCGFCFLEYDCHSAALNAKKLLNRGNVWGRQLFVDWAQRRKQPDENDLTESKTLFINNLPKETTNELIIEALASYGTIEKITKIKDYAFVLFDEHQSAENAMNGVDKAKLGNEMVEISLAIPKSMKNRPRFTSISSYRQNGHHNRHQPQRRNGRNRGSNHFKGFNTSFGSSTPANKFYMRKQNKPKKTGDNNDTELPLNATRPENHAIERTMKISTEIELSEASHHQHSTIIPMPISNASEIDTLTN